MNKNNLTDKFTDEFNQAITTTIFAENLPSKWYDAVRAALRFTSPVQMKVTGIEFNELVRAGPGKITLFQAAKLNNNFQSTSPHNLGMTIGNYCELLIIADSVAVKLNTALGELHEEIKVRLGIAGPGLRVIKAEA